MKFLRSATFIFVFILGAQVSAQDAAPKNIVSRVVNFKTCVEKSKLGKQEQTAFDALKKQMEKILEDREKALNEMAVKFEDPDYLDSLSADAETELKRKFRGQNQEFTQMQTQYYQALQQTNFKVVQKLTDFVTKASEAVAKRDNIDLIINDETLFFSNPALNISTQVVAVMDEMFDKETGENAKPLSQPLPEKK